MNSEDQNAATPREEGLECPHCDEDWDSLMDRPALKRVGWNPHSGRLYSCSNCSDRVTEAEMELGVPLGDIIKNGKLDSFTPERRREA